VSGCAGVDEKDAGGDAGFVDSLDGSGRDWAEVER